LYTVYPGGIRSHGPWLQATRLQAETVPLLTYVAKYVDHAAMPGQWNYFMGIIVEAFSFDDLPFSIDMYILTNKCTYEVCVLWTSILDKFWPFLVDCHTYIRITTDDLLRQRIRRSWVRTPSESKVLWLKLCNSVLCTYVTLFALLFCVQWYKCQKYSWK
jgi:hypothetical protein